MAFSHLIAHRVRRASPESATQVDLRSREISLNGRADELARELRQSYIKKLGKIFGRFSDDIGNCPLPAWLQNFLDGKASFSNLSKQFTQHFVSLLDNSEAVADGYWVYALEDLEGTQTFYAVWLTEVVAQQFDAEFNLIEVHYLDTKSISLACRINLGEWLSGDSQSYLGVLTRRGEKELSDCFVQALGFTDKRDCKAETEAFLETVETYTAQQPEEKKAETRSKVVEFCLEQDKQGKPVEMRELSAFVDEGNQQQFASFVQREKPELKTSLIPDKTQLKNYIRISGRNELMSMSFESVCLGETVIYDQDNDSLTINNLPSSLKSRLLKHLHKGR